MKNKQINVKKYPKLTWKQTKKQTVNSSKRGNKQTNTQIKHKLTDEKQTNTKHELNQITNNNNIKSSLNIISDSPGKGILNLQHHNAQKNTTPYSVATQIALQ